MDWKEFVNPERIEFHVRVKSFGGALFEIAQEVAEHNTLSNWVRETNARLH
jgi:hypothetical protein